jgi:hypothetical protein
MQLPHNYVTTFQVAEQELPHGSDNLAGLIHYAEPERSIADPSRLRTTGSQIPGSNPVFDKQRANP